MSWRFRKSFKVLPGVRLNISRSGVSTTLGSGLFSLNVGPKGVYRNVRIPGTGFSMRNRLDQPRSQRSIGGLAKPAGQSLASPSTSARSVETQVLPTSTEIRSASTDHLTSHSTEQLRNLLREAYEERTVLVTEISVATAELSSSKKRYESWERGFLMKHVRKNTFAARKEAFDTAAAKLDELQEQLRLTALATEIEIEAQQADGYYRLRDAFAALSRTQKVWNVLTEQAIDRVKERTTHNKTITRNPVAFSLASCDLIQWSDGVPHLPNHTGGEMYIYPGFVLYRAAKQAFALLDFRDVRLKFVSMRFTETGPVPSDSEIVDHTWAKCNKDGTPDRRFQGNHQIPIAHYGELLFRSPSGLDVRYLCSSPSLARQFASAWDSFRTSFSA